MRRVLACLLLFCGLATAQQTILNVPSADVLDRSQGYFRGDIALFPAPGTGTFAGNFIFGAGHNVEAGVNINAFGWPASFSNRAIVPNFKWKFFSHPIDSGRVDLYLGDQVFFPTYRKVYNVGNYFYAAAAWSRGNTRITGGGFNSESVIATGNRTGALLGLEQTVKSRANPDGSTRALITLAGDWQSGRGSNGALALGVMFFPTDRWMLIPAFQIPNSGDHTAAGPEIFIGYRFK